MLFFSISFSFANCIELLIAFDKAAEKKINKCNCSGDTFHLFIYYNIIEVRQIAQIICMADRRSNALYTNELKKKKNSIIFHIRVTKLLVDTVVDGWSIELCESCDWCDDRWFSSDKYPELIDPMVFRTGETVVDVDEMPLLWAGLTMSVLRRCVRITPKHMKNNNKTLN